MDNDPLQQINSRIDAANPQINPNNYDETSNPTMIDNISCESINDHDKQGLNLISKNNDIIDKEHQATQYNMDIDDDDVDSYEGEINDDEEGSESGSVELHGNARPKLATEEDIDAQSVRNFGAALLNMLDGANKTSSRLSITSLSTKDEDDDPRRTSITSPSQIYANPDLVKRMVLKKSLKEVEQKSKENKNDVSLAEHFDGQVLISISETQEQEHEQEQSPSKKQSAPLMSTTALLSPPCLEQESPITSLSEDKASNSTGPISKISNWFDRQRAKPRQMKLDRQAKLQREKLQKIMSLASTTSNKENYQNIEIIGNHHLGSTQTNMTTYNSSNKEKSDCNKNSEPKSRTKGSFFESLYERITNFIWDLFFSFRSVASVRST